MVTQLLRALGYAAGAAACRVASHSYFGGSDVAFLSLFVLAAFAAEFALPALTSPAGKRPGPGVGTGRFTWRTAAFLAAVVGLLTCGSALVSSAMSVRAADKAPHKCDVVFKEPSR